MVTDIRKVVLDYTSDFNDFKYYKINVQTIFEAAVKAPANT